VTTLQPQDIQGTVTGRIVNIRDRQPLVRDVTNIRRLAWVRESGFGPHPINLPCWQCKRWWWAAYWTARGDDEE